MEKALAREITATLLECSRKIDESIALVKQRSSEEEFREYRRGAGRIMGTILLEVLEPIFRDHPDLEPPGLREQ